MADYDIGKAFDAIEQELIASMIRNMDRHRAEETKEGIEWSMWQAEQLKALEKYKVDNHKKYGPQFKNLNDQMSQLIWASRKKGNMNQEVAILKAIKNGFEGYKHVSSTAQAEFFRMNTRKLEALIGATTHDMGKAETAVLRMADDQYRKAIFNAQVYANTGAGTYEKAVDMATKNMLSAGLNCVEYSNGARHTLADYADMAIRTASKRAYLQGEGEKRQEWGIATVIMNKRGNPCPKCLPFVGKILLDDVWSGGKKSDGKYPLMSTAIGAGLYHPRCKDSHSTYFEGISTPPDDAFTQKEIKQIETVNKQEVEQQYAARQADKFGRLAEYSLDENNKTQYSRKEKEWEAKTDVKEIKIFGKDIKPIIDSPVQQPNMTAFEPAKTLQEAKEYALGNLNILLKNADDIPLETINSINKQYTSLLKENPHMKGFIQDFEFTDSLDTGSFAARELSHDSDGRIRRKILFNRKEYMDMDALNKQYAASVKTGHFPKGTNAGNILDHEFAHAMADDMGLRMSHIDINEKFTSDEWITVKVAGKAFSTVRIENTAKKLKITPKKLQRKISGYATEDCSEAFAEAFSSSCGTKPSKEALAVVREYDRIKKMYIKGV